MTPGPQAGFSLIELMVVVAVLSVLAIGASLALPRSMAAGPSDRALFLAEDIALRRLALLTRAPVALRVDTDGFVRMAAQPGSGWQPIGTPTAWAGSAKVDLPPEAPALIAYLPDGRSTAFDLVFQEPGGAMRCRTGGWEPPQCAPR